MLSRTLRKYLLLNSISMHNSLLCFDFRLLWMEAAVVLLVKWLLCVVGSAVEPWMPGRIVLQVLVNDCEKKTKVMMHA